MDEPAAEHDEAQEIAERIAAWARGERPGPYALEIYPTLRCNLECRYCDTTLRHVKPDPESELPGSEVTRIVDEAAALGARKLSLLGGGEPLEAPEATFGAMERAKAHGMHGILGTNATLLSTERIALLVALGWDEVHVSLDGPDAETNDSLRDGSFRRAATAIAQLSAARIDAGSATPRIAIHCVVTQNNLDALPALVRFAAENGVARVNCDHVVPYTPEMETLRLGPGDTGRLREVVAEARLEAIDLGVAEDLENLLAAGAAERGRDRAAPVRIPDRPLWQGSPCYFPWFYLSVRSDGTCGPCCVASGEGLPSLRGRPLAEVWHGEISDRLRRRMRLGISEPYCCECSGALRRLNTQVRSRLAPLPDASPDELELGLREALSLAEAERAAEQDRATRLSERLAEAGRLERRLRDELEALHQRRTEEKAGSEQERFSLARRVEDALREREDLARYVAFVERERDALRAGYQHLEARLRAILTSKSWRFLRFLGIVRDV